ncbi:MAG: photosynthetic reaction center cytochrome c subunit [Gammaproteobacteria bacterium]|nr:photosynthetic reaction center cytochrome c subunit [Gammaproteobacteria bacterium]
MATVTTSSVARRLLIISLGCVWLGGCEAPPPESTQSGYRGTGMVQVENPRKLARLVAASTPPAGVPAPAAAAGPKASEVFKNVQVLGDLDVASFTHLMASVTEWVSPEQGCAYCHEGNDLSQDTLYTKVVARRMLEMTRGINDEWQVHAGQTGVTCYTCHRGKPVPERIWFKDPGPPQALGAAARRNGQNLASASVGYASLPFDTLSRYLGANGNIRVVSTQALPGRPGSSIDDTEHTYGLMMHLTDSLGVNCTYCHNSRAFSDWQQSPAARVTAWHGIQMVRALNADYLVPLSPQYPPNRLGVTGDGPKLSCATCHRGQPKPLNGVSMLSDVRGLSSK